MVKDFNSKLSAFYLESGAKDTAIRKRKVLLEENYRGPRA